MQVREYDVDVRDYNVDVMMQAITRVVGGFLSFFAIFLLTYLFNESEIGEYNLILSTVNIIASLGTLWLSQSVLRFYEEKRDLGAIIILTSVSVVICVVVYFILNLFIRQSSGIWSFIYVVLLVLYNVFDAVFRRARQLKNYVILELLFAASRLFPMVVIAFITHNYNAIFASQSLVVLAFFIVLIIKNARNNYEFRQIRIKVESTMLKQYFRFGIPLMGLAISNWFLTTSDRYIIKFYGDNAQVGVYSTNYSLANSIYMMFSLIIVNAFHPIIMREWSKDEEGTRKLVSHTIDLYLMLMIPLTFYGCLKSKILLGLFNGDIYASHEWIFNWTTLGIFIYGLSLLYHKYFELIEKTKMILIINVIAAISNIIMNIILIPIFGFGVAAFTTFVSYLIYIVILRMLTYKKFRLNIKLKNIAIILSSIIAFAVVDYIFMKSDSVISFFVEGIIYVIYTLVVYELTEIIDFKSLIKMIKIPKKG